MMVHYGNGDGIYMVSQCVELPSLIMSRIKYFAMLVILNQNL